MPKDSRFPASHIPQQGVTLHSQLRANKWRPQSTFSFHIITSKSKGKWTHKTHNEGWCAAFSVVSLRWRVTNVCMQIVTMPEYLGRRFGGERIRTYLAVLSLLLSVFTKISVHQWRTSWHSITEKPEKTAHGAAVRLNLCRFCWRFVSPPDWPVLWSAVCSGVSGVEPLPVHCPNAGGHCFLYNCR